MSAKDLYSPYHCAVRILTDTVTEFNNDLEKAENFTNITTNDILL